MEGLLSTGPTLSSLSKKIQILKIAQLNLSQVKIQRNNINLREPKRILEGYGWLEDCGWLDCFKWLTCHCRFAALEGVDWKALILKLEKIVFKELALWADAFYKSICPSVCPSVRVSVHF